MDSLQETKKRLKSINITKKITKAMQLVATSKIRKAKSNLESIQEYCTSIYETFQKLLNNISDDKKIFPPTTNDSTLHIIITSDLGLCGGYNSNVLKILKTKLKPQDKVIVLGNKGILHLKSIGINIYQGYNDISDNPDYKYASDIGSEAIALFLNGESSKVNLIYTKFINSVTFKNVHLQLLPIKKDKHILKYKSQIEFEPSAEIVVKKSISLYVSSLIFGAIAESKVSEMSSRRIAMENATNNADDLIKKLKLKYNRARQSKITQEISEIVSGGSEVK